MELNSTSDRPVLEVIQASKVYREDGNLVYALREANLVLTKGSFAAIVGRSGCGKSTLLNLAGAVDLPSGGEALVEGLSTRQLSDNELSRLRRKRIGFVFQFFNLLPTLTAAENVELPLLLDLHRGSPGARAGLRGRAAEMLGIVGLAEKAARLPHQLSGGEMQRVAIARALVHRPSLIVADEPTGNLDSATAEIILQLLRRVAAEMGHTILMATHSKEAADFATQVHAMRDGRLTDS